MSKRTSGALLFIGGVGMGLLSIFADTLGLDAPGSFGLAQVQGVVLGLLGTFTGLYRFFWRPAASGGHVTRRGDVTRFDDLNLVDMTSATRPSGEPAFGHFPVEILDPQMLEQQRTPFVPGQAWRIVETDDDGGPTGGD